MQISPVNRAHSRKNAFFVEPGIATNERKWRPIASIVSVILGGFLCCGLIVGCGWSGKDESCHRFGSELCFLPYPSDQYLGVSPVTGTLRLAGLPTLPGLRPAILEDGHAFWSLRGADGFPVRGGLLIEAPCDLHEDHLGQSATDGGLRISDPGNVLMIEASTGRKVPLDILYYRKKPCVIEVRPRQVLRPARKYVLALTGFRDSSGGRIKFSAAFQRQLARPSHARREPTRRALMALERYLRLPARDVQLALSITTASLARPLGALRSLVNRLADYPVSPLQVAWRRSDRAGIFAEARGEMILPRICVRYPTGPCRIESGPGGLPRIDGSPRRSFYRLLLPDHPALFREDAPAVLLVNAAAPERLDRLFARQDILDFAYRSGLILAALEVDPGRLPRVERHLNVDNIVQKILHDILFARLLGNLARPADWSGQWARRPRVFGFGREGRFARVGLMVNPFVEAILIEPTQAMPGLPDRQTDVYGLRFSADQFIIKQPGSFFAPEPLPAHITRFFARETPLYFFDWLRPERIGRRWKSPPVRLLKTNDLEAVAPLVEFLRVAPRPEHAR